MKVMRVNIEEIARSLNAHSGNISAVAKELGYNRETVSIWARRCKSFSKGRFKYRGIKHKSTKPKNIHYALTLQQEARVITLRDTRHLDQSKIAKLIFKQYGVKVSPKTIYNVIKRRQPELITPKKNYLRPRFQNGNHMRPANTKELGCLQADVKYVTPELSGLDYTTYEFAYVDIYSRYKVAWIMPTLDQEASIVALRHAIKQMPFKVKFVQTDNGWENGSKFHQECVKQEIEHYYIHKSSPNENAVIERTFRIDQDEFFYWLKKRPNDLNELNIWFGDYIKFYNEERPHFGLDLKTPLEVINIFKENYGGDGYVVT